jgi:hypothetical protein
MPSLNYNGKYLLKLSFKDSNSEILQKLKIFPLPFEYRLGIQK